MRHAVLVTGSRTWTTIPTIRAGLRIARQYLDVDDENMTLVSGACRVGADPIAETLAALYGWHVQQHPADWDTFGKKAGFVRNLEMVNSGIDLVIAFQKGDSPGTGMTIDLARAAMIPVFIWTE